ncbi:putative GTP-binding protein EngB [candidate division SR1 bacterium]|nr:putative GTP-binding protein EngB [candidate division SR1 bacterium]
MQASFVISAPNLRLCPPPSVPEVAFFGRSNVGKSTLINMLTNRKSLAKASNIPGKTRLINFFLVKGSFKLDPEKIVPMERQIVDLPGYGYAKASEKEKKGWMDMTQDFLTKRETLKKIFLLIDASIPPQKIDLEMIDVLIDEKVSFDLVFTKIDKGTQKEKSKYLREYQSFLSKKLGQKGMDVKIFQVSHKGKGRTELLARIDEIVNS